MEAARGGGVVHPLAMQIRPLSSPTSKTITQCSLARGTDRDRGLAHRHGCGAEPSHPTAWRNVAAGFANAIAVPVSAVCVGRTAVSNGATILAVHTCIFPS
jgi:hypothetical protein